MYLFSGREHFFFCWQSSIEAHCSQWWNIMSNHLKAIHGVDTMSTAPWPRQIAPRITTHTALVPYGTDCDVDMIIIECENLSYILHMNIYSADLTVHMVMFPHGQFLQPFTTALSKAKSLIQLDMVRPLHFQHCASSVWSLLFALDGFRFYIHIVCNGRSGRPSFSKFAGEISHSNSLSQVAAQW